MRTAISGLISRPQFPPPRPRLGMGELGPSGILIAIFLLAQAGRLPACFGDDPVHQKKSSNAVKVKAELERDYELYQKVQKDMQEANEKYHARRSSEESNRKLEGVLQRAAMPMPSRAVIRNKAQSDAPPAAIKGKIKLPFQGKELEFPFEINLDNGVTPPPPPIPVDSDGDGIADVDDKCPNDPTNKCNDPPPPPPVVPDDVFGVDLFKANRPNLARALAENHPLVAVTLAHQSQFGEKGFMAEGAWLLTGTQKSLNDFHTSLFYPWQEKTELSLTHITDSSFPRMGIFYQDMKRDGRLTAAQEALCVKRLAETAEFVTTDGQIRLNDSDVVVACVLGTALTDTLLGTDYMNRLAMGGWSYDPIKGPHGNMRNMLNTYCEQLAKGGVWIESEMYNIGTVYRLASAHDALVKLRGKDDFPEVAKFLADAKIAAGMGITPDNLHALSWGDTQQPNHLWLLYRYASLAALGRNDLVREIYKVNPSGGYNVPWYGWGYINLYETGTVKEPFALYAPGQGMFLDKDADSLFGGRFASAEVIDHNQPFVQGDFSLYHKGAFAVHSPRLYGDPYGQLNTMAFAGMEGFNVRQEPVTWGDQKTWFGIRGGDYGYPSGTYFKGFEPDPILPERTRTLVYLTDPLTVIVRDRFTILDPIAVGGIDKYASYSRWQATKNGTAANQFRMEWPPLPAWNSSSYYIFSGEKFARVTNWEADPSGGIRVTYDNSTLQIKDGEVVAVKGGGPLSRLLESKHLAKWQMYLPLGGIRGPPWAYSIGRYSVDVLHYGDGTTSIENTEPLLNGESDAYPQRMVTTTQTPGSHDWYHVIRVGHSQPVEVSGDSVKVGGRTVTVGETVEVN